MYYKNNTFYTLLSLDSVNSKLAVLKLESCIQYLSDGIIYKYTK